MLSREYSPKGVRSSKTVLAVIGIMSGVLCGLFGVGALLAAYVSRVTENSDSFKANLSAVCIADNTFSIILYGMLGMLAFDTANTVLMLMPLALLGLFAGMKFSDSLNQKSVSQFTSVLLVLSGIALILKNV